MLKANGLHKALLTTFLLTGFQWYHTDQIWRNCSTGFFQISNLQDILLQDVSSYGSARSSTWTNISSSSA